MNKDKEEFEGETISSESINKNFFDLNAKIEQSQIEHSKDAEPCADDDDGNDYSALKGTKIKFKCLKNSHILLSAFKQQISNTCAPANNITSNESSQINEKATTTQNTENNNNHNKVIVPQKHSHIPYILNGELYQIQTQKGENVTVKCCNCPPDRIYRGSVRSTGNFHMHIKRRHPHLMSKLHEMKVRALLERRDRIIKQRATQSPPKPLQRIYQRHSAPMPFQTTNEIFHVNKKKNSNAIAALMETEEEIIIKSPPNAHEMSNTASTSSNGGGTLADYHKTWHSSSASPVAPAPFTNKYSRKTNNKLVYKIKPEVTSTLVNPIQVTPIDLSKSNSTANSYGYKKDNRPAYRAEGHPHCQINNELSTTNTKEILVHLGDTLQNLERTMCVRNQLESNRILFDVSKFKYLHPDFVFEF